MRSTPIIASIIGTGILSGIVYIQREESRPSEGIDLLTQSIMYRVENIVRVPIALPQKVPVTGLEHTVRLSEKDILLSWLDQNQEIKRRIQASSWYRDFLRDNLSSNVFRSYLLAAQDIETVIKQYPGMLEMIQYEEWWQKYLSGETNPIETQRSSIAKSAQALDVLRKYPQSELLLAELPTWKEGLHGEPGSLNADRISILGTIASHFSFLDTHRAIETRLKMSGYTRNDFFRHDWKRKDGVYEALYAIREIEGEGGISSETRIAFFASEMGQQYLRGELSPIRAREILETWGEK